MEKLEPILKHKFWILLGVALLLPVFAWWSTTGKMAAAITERTTAIENAINGIPKGVQPNQVWIENAKTIANIQEEQVKKARHLLWQEQTKSMVWPSTIASYAEQVGYRGEFPPAAAERYRNDYLQEVIRVWRTVDPIEQVDPRDPKSKRGIVDFAFAKMPREDWGQLPPNSEEMWNAQEDLWLAEALLTSIKRTNGDIRTRQEATLLAINKFQLLGGNRAALSSGGAADPNMMMSMDDEGYVGDLGAETEEYEDDMGMGMGRAGGVASADFNPADEFGSDAMAPTAVAADASLEGPAEGLGGGSGFSGLGGLPGRPQKRRYVDNDEAMPYKTRGFYLSVIMDHKRIPQLLVELTHSPWPVQITRVQYVRLHNDNTTGSAAGGMMAGGGYGTSPYSPSYGTGFGFGTSSYGSDEYAGGEAAESYDYGSNYGGSGISVSGNDPVLLNPDLAHVAISGLMTIYKPVEATATDGTTTETPADADPSAADPTLTDPTLTDVTATDPAAEPAAVPTDDATAPAENAVPAEPTPTPTQPAATEEEAAPPPPIVPE